MKKDFEYPLFPDRVYVLVIDGEKQYILGEKLIEAYLSSLKSKDLW